MKREWGMIFNRMSEVVKMAENTPKRKIKDSVFTNLFQDKKQGIASGRQ